MLLARLSAIVALLTIPVGMWLVARQAQSEESGAEEPSAGRVLAALSRQWTEQQVFEQSFDVSPGASLMADVPDSDFEIRTGSVNTVVVNVFVRSRDPEWGREVFERMEFTARATNNGVTVRAIDPRIERREWRGNRGVGVTTRIVVPERFNLDVHTADGDIQVLNVIEGAVALRSSDGDIRIEGVRGDRVVIETADGDIDTRTIAAATVSVRTSDGDIVMRGVSGEVDARTSDGDVTIEFAEVRGATVNTYDGDIFLYAPQNLRADVTLEGEGLSVDRGLTLRGRMSSRRIEGHLNGGGVRILARTNDGDIDFRIR